MTANHERLLDLSTAAYGNAEVFAVSSERRHVEFEANRPKNIGQRQSSGIALRIINKKGCIGFSSTSDDDKVDDLVERSGALSQYGAEAKFQFPSAADYPSVETVDDATSGVTDEQLLDFGRSAIESILTEYPEALCSADFSKSSGQQRLLNSSGVDVEHSQTACSFYMGVELIRDTDMLSIWDGIVLTGPIDGNNVEKIVERLLDETPQFPEHRGRPERR